MRAFLFNGLRYCAACVLAALFFIASLPKASANDSGLTISGTPMMLHGNTTVSMVSENIKIDVYDGHLVADCSFEFKNNGPACTIRLGFPDRYKLWYSSAEDDARYHPDNRPVGTMTWFKSYVSGKRVKTTLVSGPDAFSWHVKNVKFAANAVTHVRDVYSVEVYQCDGTIDGEPGSVSAMEYVVHTGASWHGEIARSVISVTLHRRDVKLPIHPLRLAEAADTTAVPGDGNTADLPEGARVKKTAIERVVYRGMAEPRVIGRTLRFVRSNWKPAVKDDLRIWFGYSKP